MKSSSIGPARTPRGKGKPGKGALTGVHPQELLATVLRELPARAGFEVADVDDLVTGAVGQVNEQRHTSWVGPTAGHWLFWPRSLCVDVFAYANASTILLPRTLIKVTPRTEWSSPSPKR